MTDKNPIDMGLSMLQHIARNNGITTMEGTVGKIDPQTGLISLDLDFVSVNFTLASLRTCFEKMAQDLKASPPKLPEGYTIENVKTAIQGGLASLSVLEEEGKQETVFITNGKGVFAQLAVLAAN